MSHPWSNRCWHALLLGAMLLAGSGLSLADADADHDRARQALEAGEVLPLRTILERVERDYPGQVVDVELERDERDHGPDRGRWVYKIKVLGSGGALVKLKLDARDGSLLGRRGRERH